MKKALFLLVFSISFLLPVSVLALPGDPVNPCQDGWRLEGNNCISPTGAIIPVSTTPPVYGTRYCPDGKTPVPTNGICPPSAGGPPVNGGGSPTGGGSGSSALPECTDNYNSTQICLPKNPVCTNGGIACSGSVTELAAKVVSILLYFAGIVAVIFVIIGGYKYMTAGGNEEAAKKGRQTLTQAIIGLIIVILAYVIITAVTNFLLNK